MSSSSSSASEILQELESLKNEKTKIEQKISSLESQLKDINLPKHASNGSSSPYPTNGLEPHMIHRYSRHLVLPSFGVQGTTHSFI
jgi:adenylyltransferase and sulfurtransferase